MPKKTGGKDGSNTTKLRPINGGKKKSNHPTLDEATYKRIPDIDIPAKILGAKVTPKSLASLSYQRKLLGVFAPYLLPALLNGLHRNLNVADDKAQRLVADIFGMTPKSNGGVNVLVNQQNAQVSRAAGQVDDGAIGSFEDIARILHERRRSLPQAASREIIAPVFEATPED